MSNHLIIEDETGVRQLPLLPGITRLGSGTDCELRLEHEEVQPLALTLDFRGETLLVHNRNPFAVFLGDEELQPSQMAAWHESTPLRMTRSITLTLSGNGATVPKPLDDEEPTEKKASSSQRQLIHLVVIGLCLAVGYWELNRETNPTAAAEVDEFDDVLNPVIAKIGETRSGGMIARSAQWREVMRLLQEAYFLETRPGQPDTTAAIEAYQRVLETDLIRDAKPQDDKQLEARVFRFATAKKVLLND